MHTCGFQWKDGWGSHACWYSRGHDGRPHTCKCDQQITPGLDVPDPPRHDSPTARLTRVEAKLGGMNAEIAMIMRIVKSVRQAMSGLFLSLGATYRLEDDDEAK